MNVCQYVCTYDLCMYLYIYVCMCVRVNWASAKAVCVRQAETLRVCKDADTDDL